MICKSLIKWQRSSIFNVIYYYCNIVLIAIASSIDVLDSVRKPVETVNKRKAIFVLNGGDRLLNGRVGLTDYLGTFCHTSDRSKINVLILL